MVSSDVLRSSPLEGTRRALHDNSSSPDLPPLQDVLTTKPATQSSVLGNRATPISIDESSGFISASHLYQAVEPLPKAVLTPLAAFSPTVACRNQAASPSNDITFNGGFIAGDPAPLKELEEQQDDIVVVKITGKGARKPRQPKVSKPVASKRAKPKSVAKPKALGKGAPGKGLSPTGDDIGKDNEEDETKPKTSKAKAKKTGTMSNHFPPTEESNVSEERKQVDVNEPLHLEQAPARRLDWTPPAQKTVVNVESDSSVLKTLGSSEAGHPLPIFKDLVEGYSCLETPADPAPPAMLSTSDEDSSFLKKRKRIELLATKGANSAVVEPDKSPTKKTPKKKKPRTITELATAAYRVPTQPDASILDHFQTANNETVPAGDAQPNTKGKRAQRRKTVKAPKKKVPPKPVLLSPGAALAQVANQDFVFGTSSQLAREESPTVLRDLQAALRRSNQNDDIDLAIPINSDAIDPPDQRSNLWDAAARGAEGDLFDDEVINLTEVTSRLPQEGNHTNPFGYNLGEDDSVIVMDGRVSDDYEPSAKLPDAMQSPGEKAAYASRGGSPYFSDSDLSTSMNIQRLAPEKKEDGHEHELVSAVEANELPKLPELSPQPPRPKYETFTDIRLAREIKKFGFKPIKRRSAMIALLDQCWQSKVRMGQAGPQPSAKSPAISKPRKKTTSPATPSSQKKPRGRPRKDSISASELQEPPPSAQPPETPKRPRGLPKKDSLGSPLGTLSPRKPKSISPSKRTATSPRGRRTGKKSVIEIPDSEDDEGNFASSPETNLDQMFSSPPPLNMSLTTNDSTEPPLTATPTDQEVALFEHITNAVRSAPRTTDPQEPSWHEKILLYDPVVLEDLATWLNTGELSRVGYDGEVNPNDVKKWCESKSICCLWRVTHRGKERKRV
ncbi:hypothetical protein FGRMN_8703 [Fusarium graminum]|nr:hypothetical protein FGRMN_8703 [Fusarium graminum]